MHSWCVESGKWVEICFHHRTSEKISFLYFFLPKSWIWQTLGQVTKKISYCHFHNASKECFWPKKNLNFMHGFKSAILAIFQLLIFNTLLYLWKTSVLAPASTVYVSTFLQQCVLMLTKFIDRVWLGRLGFYDRCMAIILHNGSFYEFLYQHSCRKKTRQIKDVDVSIKSQRYDDVFFPQMIRKTRQNCHCVSTLA